ncbi:hypothetical protein M8J75_013768 [Diaphorina citri]|nr:hypothetical protein M8J75_013768 [Diaphorina citri]
MNPDIRWSGEMMCKFGDSGGTKCNFGDSGGTKCKFGDSGGTKCKFGDSGGINLEILWSSPFKLAAPNDSIEGSVTSPPVLWGTRRKLDSVEIGFVLRVKTCDEVRDGCALVSPLDSGDIGFVRHSIRLKSDLS